MKDSCSHENFNYLTLRKSKIPGRVIIHCSKCGENMYHVWEHDVI